MDVIERARRYLAAIPPAVSGQGGDLATHKVAVALVKGFGFPPETAMAPMLEWNERCLPPWSQAQLMSKLRSAARAPAPTGSLLAEPGAARLSFLRKSAPRAERRLFREDSPRQPSDRDPLPADLRVPTIEEQIRIAELRGLSPCIPIFAANAGILRVGVWERYPAYFLVGRGVVQARRLDGTPWQFRSGREGKAWTIGPVDAFGIRHVVGADPRRIILTEGLVSILEGLEVLYRAEEECPYPMGGTCLVAAYSAGSRLTRTEASYLARRRVLILADGGASGLAAAKAWRASIREMGGREVHAMQFDDGDLGHALRESPHCPREIRSFLEQ